MRSFAAVAALTLSLALVTACGENFVGSSGASSTSGTGGSGGSVPSTTVGAGGAGGAGPTSVVGAGGTGGTGGAGGGRTGCAVACGANQACSPDLTSCVCTEGFADCDGEASSGCEVNLLTSNADCGACGKKCSTGEFCGGGLCQTPQVVDVAAGKGHSCAVFEKGILKCWGA
ncbi:MAG: hypothetical protein FJ095_21390, partial [Deltaproteobacteria bacterium]|nr:hypothetical protein [Deltaproteobacteria bacterium]